MRSDADQLGPAIAQAREALEAGNALLCYDIVTRAGKRGFRSPELEYLAILALANCGSTQQALDRYHLTERLDVGSDQDWLALEGRLLKDLARLGGAAAHFLFERSAESYWKAFQKTGGYFSAVNAATMFMLAGDGARAQKLARDVLTLTSKTAARDEHARYNLHVSYAEAALLVADEEGCRKSLRAADALIPENVAARARTVSQLKLICQHLKLDKSLASLLTVPPQVYLFREEEIDVDDTGADRVDAGKVALPSIRMAGARVHLALHAPVDLCLLEHFSALGSQVSVVIPGAREELMQNWQDSHGSAWAMRLAAGFGLAQEVSATPGFLESEPKWARQYVAAKAFGLSRLLLSQIRTDWIGLRVVKQKTGPGIRFQVFDKAMARQAERTFAEVAGPLSESPRGAGVKERRACSILFADFRGLRKIADAELPRFWARVVAGTAQILKARRQKILLRKTWGDALQVVAADAVTAAEIALEIQEAIADISREKDGILSALELRIALHFAPVFVGEDAVAETPTCYGSELTFAARIEPVTPPGVVFVTEAFAARLAIESAEKCRLEYAGEVELADGYGQCRLFALRGA